MKEIWKDLDIDNLKDLYEISSLGNIKSKERIVKRGGRGNNINYITLKPRILKQRKNNRGYHMITLYELNGERHDYLVHRLVGLMFIPNPENKPEINHKNGNKDDNSVKNLEWNTGSENMKHAFKTGIRKAKPITEEQKKKLLDGLARSNKKGGYRKSIYQINPETNEIIKEFKSATEAANYIGGDPSNIRDVACGTKKRRTIAYGYKWKYKE